MFWKNKVIFLTGASSGIGEALALEMAERGSILGLLARRAELLENLAKKCEEAGAGAARYFAVDVTDAEAVAEAAKSLREEFGKIDILIANAGIGGNRDARQFQAEAVTEVINTNLVGAVNAVSAVLPQMLECASGQLVAISSLAAYRGIPKSAAYCASKAGMTAFFESVRLDVQNKGIFVTIIHPGFIKTPLTSGREHKMPFLMELDAAIPHFIRAIEKRKKFAAFPHQLAGLVRAGKFSPAWLYDRIVGRAKYRE